MPSGVYMYSPFYTLLASTFMPRGKGWIIYYRRGAFGVARFDRLGNARALMRGTSDRIASTLFLLIFSGGSRKINI